MRIVKEKRKSKEIGRILAIVLPCARAEIAAQSPWTADSAPGRVVQIPVISAVRPA